MALHFSSIPIQCYWIYNVPSNMRQTGVKWNHARSYVQCLRNTQIQLEKRPSANYQPTIWNYDLVEYLRNDHADDIYKERARKLEEEVSIMIEECESPLTTLELIDHIERLGLAYRFEKDIGRALDRLVSLEGHNVGVEKSVHATALNFRLLRQHGYHVSQEVFRNFKDHTGGFKECLQEDVKGLLSLYEASYVAFEGETLLDEAKSFTKMHLERHMHVNLSEEINHAMELPLHRRMVRLEARWYIDAYSTKKDVNLSLLELAKVDFNMVQSTLQNELKESTRWWKNIGLASRLNFIRDRLMECFFWTLGVVSQPQYSTCRKWLTKVSALITTIDDIYDVYGSLDELQLFTDAVQRWDVNIVKTLPDYMKLCFLALYNSVNEMAYDTLKETGVNIIPLLTNAWTDLFQAFLVEAKWNKQRHTPTLEDYIDNGWVSVSGVVILVHAYFQMNQNITKEALLCLENYHDLLKWSSVIFRLCNDLGTSSAELERGETANSIMCYMRENEVSEEIAHEHIISLIDEAWKKMNKFLVVDSPFAKPFIETAINLARISQSTYQYGDGHGNPDNSSRNKVLSLIIEPIALVDSSNVTPYSSKNVIGGT